MNYNSTVKSYWEKEVCGSHDYIVNEEEKYTLPWFQEIEDYRYKQEPFIHSEAQFTRHRNKEILEIGVGAGTDHLQWARAGAHCCGVDLTMTAIETTKKHLAHYGLVSDLHCLDAEQLPFNNDSFDTVYSWGVIHHSAHPEQIIKEIFRVLKPGGIFIGMMYNRHSIVAYMQWVRAALTTKSITISLRDALAKHVESEGTKAYTKKELRVLFSKFQDVKLKYIVTPYDQWKFPSWIASSIPCFLGWFISIQAKK